MAKICLDARFYRKSTAGVGRYTRGLIHNLQPIDRDNDYTVILTPADYAEWAKTDLPNWHVKVMDVPHFSNQEQTELKKFLDREKFDLVHFTQFNHPIFYRGPFVVTIHDLILHKWPPRPIWHPRTWAYRYTMHDAAKRARKIITPSAETKKDVVSILHVAADKITITLEAVEPEFQPQKGDHAKVKEKFGITKPFLLYMNAWRPHKGLPELVAAFLEIAKDHNLQLLIAGKPDPSFPEVIAAVEAAKKKSPDIITPGFIDDADAIALYSLAEAFIVPTHYEGFGLPPLEAMACGCPVVVANNSSLPEVVGDAGLYFKTGDVSDLAAKINQLINDKDLQQELRGKGLAQAKNFSFEKMARETLDVYRQALAPAPNH